MVNTVKQFKNNQSNLKAQHLRHKQQNEPNSIKKGQARALNRNKQNVHLRCQGQRESGCHGFPTQVQNCIILVNRSQHAQ